MQTTLANRVFAHPSVQAIEKAQINGWQDLAKVFVNAFDNRDEKFPIDFDHAWTWLEYARKDSALRTLKAQFIYGVDYKVITESCLAVGHGPAPDKYFMTINAFELFALRAH